MPFGKNHFWAGKAGSLREVTRTLLLTVPLSSYRLTGNMQAFLNPYALFAPHNKILHQYNDYTHCWQKRPRLLLTLKKNL
jgi:hypothetical protein